MRCIRYWKLLISPCCHRLHTLFSSFDGSACELTALATYSARVHARLCRRVRARVRACVYGVVRAGRLGGEQRERQRREVEREQPAHATSRTERRDAMSERHTARAGFSALVVHVVALADVEDQQEVEPWVAICPLVRGTNNRSSGRKPLAARARTVRAEELNRHRPQQVPTDQASRYGRCGVDSPSRCRRYRRLCISRISSRAHRRTTSECWDAMPIGAAPRLTTACERCGAADGMSGSTWPDGVTV